MNEDLVLEYVCLLAEARDRVYGPDRVLVLVWDAFKAHLCEAVKSDAGRITLRWSSSRVGSRPSDKASTLT